MLCVCARQNNHLQRLAKRQMAISLDKEQWATLREGGGRGLAAIRQRLGRREQSGTRLLILLWGYVNGWLSKISKISMNINEWSPRRSTKEHGCHFPGYFPGCLLPWPLASRTATSNDRFFNHSPQVSRPQTLPLSSLRHRRTRTCSFTT